MTPDNTAIVVRKGEQWEIQHWTREMGSSPIGPRLSRSIPFPQIGTVFMTRTEANEVAMQWEAWFQDSFVPRTKKKRKSR